MTSKTNSSLPQPSGHPPPGVQPTSSPESKAGPKVVKSATSVVAEALDSLEDKPSPKGKSLSERQREYQAQKTGREGGLKSGKIRKEAANRAKVKSIITEKLVEKSTKESPGGEAVLGIGSVVPIDDIAALLVDTIDGIVTRTVGPDAKMTADERKGGRESIGLLMKKYGERTPWVVEYGPEIAAVVWAAAYGAKVFMVAREKQNAHIDRRGEGVGQVDGVAPAPQGQGQAAGL